MSISLISRFRMEQKKMYLSSGEVFLPAITPFQSISLFEKKKRRRRRNKPVWLNYEDGS